MFGSEIWAFEAMTLMSGIMGVIELASQTIFVQVMTALFSVPLGV